MMHHTLQSPGAAGRWVFLPPAVRPACSATCLSNSLRTVASICSGDTPCSRQRHTQSRGLSFVHLYCIHAISTCSRVAQQTSRGSHTKQPLVIMHK